MRPEHQQPVTGTVYRAVLRISKALTDSITHQFRLAAQRQEQGNAGIFTGLAVGAAQGLDKVLRQGFGGRVIRVTDLPVTQCGGKRFQILLVVLIQNKQINPAL